MAEIETIAQGNGLRFHHILGVRVYAATHASALTCVVQWARECTSAYVCFTNVNTIMEAHDIPGCRGIINRADMAVPDGMPLVWVLRSAGLSPVERVYGPDFSLLTLDAAERERIPVGFYGGGSPRVLARLLESVRARFPRLEIAYAWAPPFRPLSEEEDLCQVERMRTSGARILFVGLGGHKQDFWMAAHRGRISAVMLGVGATFDFLAGMKTQAPRWMMRIGMEWFFRLVTEPRRLWKRYLKHNPRFVVLFALQLLGLKKFPNGSASRA